MTYLPSRNEMTVMIIVLTLLLVGLISLLMMRGERARTARNQHCIVQLANAKDTLQFVLDSPHCAYITDSLRAAEATKY